MSWFQVPFCYLHFAQCIKIEELPICLVYDFAYDIFFEIWTQITLQLEHISSILVLDMFGAEKYNFNLSHYYEHTS